MKGLMQTETTETKNYWTSEKKPRAAGMTEEQHKQILLDFIDRRTSGFLDIFRLTICQYRSQIRRAFEGGHIQVLPRFLEDTLRPYVDAHDRHYSRMMAGLRMELRREEEEG